jgi:hypothetical protein
MIQQRLPPFRFDADPVPDPAFVSMRMRIRIWIQLPYMMRIRIPNTEQTVGAIKIMQKYYI